MKPFSSTEVLYLHHRMIEETAGVHGVRDLNLLESALFRPFASFGGDDLYPTPYLKAAALLHSLMNNHPFVDGNKRTAIACANIFLENKFGLTIETTQASLVEFGFKVATETLQVEEIALWLEQNTQPLNCEL
ncbi:MAG: Fic family protein [bacterium]|nr:Fic family protein [bacterium]